MPQHHHVDPLTVLEPSAALDGTYALLVGTVLLSSAVALILARWRPARLPEAQLAVRPGLRRVVELGLPALILAWGLLHAFRVHATANPQGLPLANDLHEYLGFVLHWLEPRLGYVPPFRYPLWAWLAARVADGAQLAPYAAAMGLGLVSAGLLPLALYALARQLAPAGVAFAAAMMVGAMPAFLHQVGAPSDYMFGTTLATLATAATAWALLRGGWLPHAAAGVCLALNMACSYRAFTTTLLALALIATALAWRAWKQRPQVLLQALAVLLPMALMWWIYGHFRGAVSLETAVMVVHQHMAQHRGATIGWLDYPLTGAVMERTGGSWVVGQPGALRGLPWTVAFLFDAAGVGGRLGRSWEQLMPYLRHFLAMSQPLWLLLGLPACLAVGAWSARRPGWLPRGLAVVLVAFTIAIGVKSLESLPVAYRYSLQALALLPAMTLCGAAALLRPALTRAQAAPLMGLPVAFLALVLAAPGSGLPLDRGMDGAEMLTHHTVPRDELRSNRAGYRALLGLAAVVGAGDQVVDLSHAGFAATALLGRVDLQPRPLRGEPGQPWQLYVKPHSGGRRFLFDACFGNMDAHMEPAHDQLWQHIDSDPRYERWGPCMVEDKRPGSLISMSVGG
jgi:hypothetical protein